MAQSVRSGIAKLRRAVGVRAVSRAAKAGVALPVGDTLDTLLPTAIYIALVSIIDESLEQHIHTKSPGTRHRDLYSRIEFLASRGELKDQQRLHDIRNKRNSFAHDSGSFASWSEVEALFATADEELGHLGVV